MVILVLVGLEILNLLVTATNNVFFLNSHCPLLKEHFLDDAGTVRQHPPSFMPFGAGRRACLGEAVAKADLFLIFAWFLQNYSFSKVPGKEDESILKLNEKVAAGRLLCPYELCIKGRP